MLYMIELNNKQHTTMTKKFMAFALLAATICSATISCKKEKQSNILSEIATAPTVNLKNFIFSVGEDSWVIFSPGNLQYRGSDTSWRFATRQYEFIGIGGGNTTAAGSRIQQSQWIDLFGWGATGLDTMVAKPYSVSTDYREYRLLDSVRAGESLSRDHGDWGACTIKNEDVGIWTSWRTLSKSEWTYLLYNRKINGGYGEGYAFCFQSVADVYGMIVFPDTYLGPVPTQPLSASAWQTYELQGCVFLPAAGRRDGTNVMGVGLRGFYWTRNSHSTDVKYAYYLAFRKPYQQEDSTNIARYSGLAVRLVRDSIPVK